MGRVNQNTKMISYLQDQLDLANTKIEDLENRSRRYNFRLRGLPESITGLEAVVPGISLHHLELDGVHRALTALRTDGLHKNHIFTGSRKKLSRKSGVRET